MKVEIFITLKKGVLDPQGKAVERALKSMGYEDVKDLRIGKLIEMEIPGDSMEGTERKVQEMCEKLLANPVIEDYNFKID